METTFDDFELQYKRAFNHFVRMGPKVIITVLLKDLYCEKVWKELIKRIYFILLGVFSIN